MKLSHLVLRHKQKGTRLAVILPDQTAFIAKSTRVFQHWKYMVDVMS